MGVAQGCPIEVPLKKTVLNAKHGALGAKLIEFSGWEMPVQYSGILEEHNAVREAVGLFDIDHMGQIIVSGPDAANFLQFVMTCNVLSLPLAKARYSLLCYADGTIIDDTLVYRLPDRYMVVVNAGNTDKAFSWFQYHVGNFDVKIDNQTDSLCMLSLQGPRSQEVLQPLTETDLSQIAYYACAEGKVIDVPTIIARTGYTGEDGFELFFTPEKAALVWEKLMQAGASCGIKPIGLGARDTLRFEAGMPLYGHEISAEINPYEARLGWAVSLDKAFIGKDALLKAKLEGTTRRLVGFEIVEAGGVPRQGFEIQIDGKPVGFVASGVYSPTFKKMLGSGYVPTENATPGTELAIMIRNKPVKAVIRETPFYKPKRKK